MNKDIRNLEELLEEMHHAGEGEEEVTLDDILDEIGHRSFGPLILLAGLIMAAPVLGDIPGMPTTMGIFIFLTAGQILLQQEHIWLPDLLLERSVDREKLFKGIEWMQKPARYIDRLIRPRLTIFVQYAGGYAIAAICVCIAVTTPAMEVVPFVANVAGLAIMAFGLALIARDGLLALIALGLTGGATALAIYYFF